MLTWNQGVQESNHDVKVVRGNNSLTMKTMLWIVSGCNRKISKHRSIHGEGVRKQEQKDRVVRRRWECLISSQAQGGLFERTWMKSLATSDWPGFLLGASIAALMWGGVRVREN